MDAAGPIVEIRGLRFAYGKRTILKGIDLDIPSGKVSAILGTSGSFYVISRPGAWRPRLVLSGLFMAFGILAMHYKIGRAHV